MEPVDSYIDVENELMAMLSLELAREIDRAILEELMNPIDDIIFNIEELCNRVVI